MTAPSSASPLTARLLVPGAVAFFTLGVLQAMYGAAFPLFEARYGVGAGEVGWVASAHFLGSASAPPLAGLALHRTSTAAVVMFSTLLLAVGVTGVALAPVWPAVVACALLAGLGVGGVSAALNAAYASIGTRPVNLVNAVFGVGSILSPLLVLALGRQSLAWPFLTVALLGLGTVLAVRAWGVPALRPPGETTAPERPGWILVLFGLLIASYVGLEVGSGAWLARHLESLHFASPSLILSGYWLGLTGGRVLTGLWGGRVSPPRLVLASAALVTLCAFAATLPALAPAAYILTGLGLGPIFGTTLTWLSGSLSARLVPVLLVTGSVGGILAPAGLGLLYARVGPGSVPLALGALGLALTTLVGLTARLTRRTS
ncbi:MFS transporter [Deinococcus hopiensis]|uniref:Fucose permease n=1 Tax=Deinococcus hopiensis KR-140 TaxID=695939 RepID=A0A1W1VHC1_9DEIO|nr:MFS transporter [Deinococcus hopiensis]SMB92758.1 Fucose permease [Deinococcus hopiensis KR-140]